MKVLSKQQDVQFIWCPNPVTIDKSSEWGSGNFQNAPNGAFLKMKSPTEVSHLVQPNEDKTAPIGWVATNKPGYFDKCPIFIIENLSIGRCVPVNTLDGDIIYDVKVPSCLVCNLVNGQPNYEDCWIQSEEDILKNYIV
jgi:hypothetical protein